MSDEAPDILDAVAGIVADFGPIDWESLATQHDELADTLSILRQLQGIASGHRAAMRTGASGTVAPFLERASAPLITDKPATSRRESVTAPPRDDLPFTWGPLIVEEKIAAGASGDVYRAYDSKLQRHVALKLLPAPPTVEPGVPKGAQILSSGGARPSSESPAPAFPSSHTALTEARRLARVRHANVLSVHGADLFEGWVGIWTDLLRGQTLEERLRREGPIRATEAALIGIDLCRALRAVHEASLVHGDVKAANVMRDEEGSIVLLDFGSARVLGDEEERVSGTPLVMAPEVLFGDEPRAASDLYSLGVLLYRLVSGAYPLEAGTVEELVERHRSGWTSSLQDRSPNAPVEFVQIIETALAPDPEERFRGAREMEQALETFLEAAQRDRRALRIAGAMHNLPRETSTFIGREGPIRQLKQLVQEHRLVTISGPGGAGKTRVALQMAGVLLASFDEIRWLELAVCPDSARVEPEIAAAFGLGDTARGLSSALSERLVERTALLVLDNCEHLLERCGALVAELLRDVPDLTVVATSREPLRIGGEIVYPLAPLELPAAASIATGEMPRIESVALFLDRAAATGVSLALDAESSELLLRICHRLEGLPLAIELAAARVRSLSLSQILARLDDRFRLLTGGPSGKPRHQTLRALIDWSYGLLSEQERLFFTRLGIFTGGWTLEAAENVAAEGEIQPEDVLDLTQRLLEKSLIERQAGPAGAEARYRMLETIREYARGCSSESGELAVVARRHRDYFAALVHEVVPHLRSSREKASMSRLRIDLDNVRAALETGLANPGDTELVNQFGADMGRLWFGLDLWSEGRVYCSRFLSRPDPEDGFSADRFHLCVCSGFLAVQQADFEESARLFDEAVRIADVRGETSLVQVGQAYLGNLAFTQGRCADARRHQERALDLARELGDARRIGIALSNLANVLELLGEMDESERSHQESLEWARTAGDSRSMAYTLGRLGEGAFRENRLGEARRFLEESLALRREIGDRWGIAAASSGLSDVHARIGSVPLARELLDESAAIFLELGDAGSLVRTFGRMADIAIANGEFDLARANTEKTLRMAAGQGAWLDFAINLVVMAEIENATGASDQACRFLGAAERVYGELEGPPMTGSVEAMEAQRASAIAALGESVCRPLFAEGRAMDDAALFAIATRRRS